MSCKKWHWMILLLALAGFLYACVGCGGKSGVDLIPERSEVWRRRGQSDQEVTSNTKAGKGDQVWTQQRGRALLKWPDLWVRLYDDTQLCCDEIDPTDLQIKLDFGTGTGSGTAPWTWTTDHARIEVTGTTVMVAYHRGRRLTVVRVFDGQAEVRNLTGDVQETKRVSADEWALVKPGEVPRVSDRLEEMRDLARELGVWDVFHEVELDVRGGFGPDESRVSPGDVDIVFVPEDEGVDSDDDGLTNQEEEGLGTDPRNPDSDEDGLPDGREARGCTDPLSWDSDGDELGDGEEVDRGTNPCDPNDPPREPPPGERDDDDDGLTNAEEEELGTDPYNPDSDEDGLPDGREVRGCTDPLNWDSDGDELGDGEEVDRDTNPCDPNDPPREPPPGERDDDDDGLTNEQEEQLGTDPYNPDTDGDGLWDGYEVHESGTDPGDPDSDDDRLSDGEELEFGTDPWGPDTDGDGYTDGEEVLELGSDPLDPNDPPQVQPPEMSFWSDRDCVMLDECTMLRWDVEAAEAVYLDGEGVAGHDARKVCPTQATTYRLRAINDAGEVEQTVTITVLEVDFWPYDGTIMQGECTTLYWSVEGAQAVYLDGEGVVGHGSRVVCPANSRTYTLRVVSDCGEIERTVQIQVITDQQGPSIGELVTDPESENICPYDHVTIQSVITDPSGVDRAELWYLLIPTIGVGVWENVEMSRVGDTFTADIGSFGTGELRYHIIAWDNFGNKSQSPKGVKWVVIC